ncbi:hypothetical protein LTR09_007550 [Extremus antarcticus]|uniref:Uncharacterized protein n=1 Tax=Extremus antarcticus TaxID=702011 RepID=A0AAJ0DJK0_9PEZI|nr:hypothetical protein LTR09_007550 [Extremus antarcticus]
MFCFQDSEKFLDAVQILPSRSLDKTRKLSLVDSCFSNSRVLVKMRVQSFIAQMRNLEELELPSDYISQEDLDYLEHLSQLQRLSAVVMACGVVQRGGVSRPTFWVQMAKRIVPGPCRWGPEKYEHPWDGPQLAETSCFLCWSSSDEQLAWSSLWKADDQHPNLPQIFLPIIKDLESSPEQVAYPGYRDGRPTPVAVQIARERGIEVRMLGTLATGEMRRKLRFSKERDKRRAERARCSNPRPVRARDAAVGGVNYRAQSP